MGIWIVKAIIQKTIATLPFKHKVNYLFQKHVTKGLALTDELFDDRLGHARAHWRHFKANHPVADNFTSLELGTGWYPIVPLAMYLCGAGRMVTIDISDLLQTPALHATIRKFLAYAADGRLVAFIPARADRLATLETLLAKNETPQRLLKHLNCEALLLDARDTKLPAASFDLIHSNNTFEHVFPEVLKDILVEFHRLLRADGVMTHFTDHSDHFAHLDKGITIYNYLKFTPRQWQLIDNDIQPQNRWRINQYRQLLHQCGFAIIAEDNRVGSLDDLKRVKLAEPFSTFATEDVLVSHSMLVCRKA